MKISNFQDLLKDLYLQNDLNRGVKSTFIWLVEEIGELATILNSTIIDKQKASEELADIIAWAISVANILDIDIEDAILISIQMNVKSAALLHVYAKNE